MAYVVAAVVAALFLLAEMHWQQRYWFVVPAVGWWIARLVVEAAAALMLTAAVRRVPGSVLQINPLLLGVVTGATAPRIGRVPTLLREHNLNLFNLAYQRATKPIDDAIDEHSAEAQRRYVKEVVRPGVAQGLIQPKDVVEAFREHIGGRRGMTLVEQAERLAFISEIADDEAASDEEKVGTLVLRAWQIGAYASLRETMKPLPRRRYGARLTVVVVLRRSRAGRAVLHAFPKLDPEHS